ncbi:MAG: hypothetical protein KUG71_00635 [Porticoccaceae bacterium]|nr:hypothetical protein [Porticoccaceae bacterium]
MLYIALLLPGSSVAAEKNEGFSFKKLLMPGEVITGHAEFEQTCAKCHDTSRDTSQTQLCLDCHEELATEVKKTLGFHGRLSKTQKKSCTMCHTEHIGRKGDIVNLDADSFDHGQTDFELAEKHRTVLCTSCHHLGEKYREASDQCHTCHETIDRHQGILGEACQDCHSPKGWSHHTYDHDKTEFPLRGKHRQVQCNACHPDEKYRTTPTTCISCHALSDVHSGANGEQCGKCHNTSDWEKISFEHDRDTDFKLRGSHTKLTCRACHKQSAFKQKPGSECVDCHQNDDEHYGKNGRECESCHGNTRWTKLTFDHDRDTDFRLVGKHAKIQCESCHRDGLKRKDEQLSMICGDCHKADDVHRNSLGRQCQDCHNADGWRDRVQFSHDYTTFPLVGMHAVTSCGSCHASQVFSNAPKNCVDCHREEDSHEGALGTDCVGCHNPNDWLLWLFDHDRQTDFPLDGGHIELSCNDCHSRPSATASVKQSSACVACHLSDDVHNRRFGRDCGRCHITESFGKVRMR